MSEERLLELNLDWSAPSRTVPPVEQTRQAVQQKLEQVAPLKEALFAAVDAHRQEAIELLQSLVQTQSVNPSVEFERPIADLVAGYLREQGAEVRQIEPFPQRVSNWALFRGTGDGPTLLFDSHLDTVPIGDESAWTYPPFAAEIHDGKMYGRGTKDMKFGMAAALLTHRLLRAAGVELKGNIMLTSTADEECGGQMGIHPLIQTGLVKADYCIYTEGMPDQLTIGSKGWCQIEVITRGESGHTARKHLARNAVLAMCRLAPLLDGLQIPNEVPHPIVPGGTVASLNMINGGMKENVVPDSCRAVVDIRFSPGTRPEEIMGQVEKILAEARLADPDLQVEARPINVARPSFMSEDEPLVQYLAASVEQVVGKRPEARGMPATSDARYIWLDAGIPVVNYSMGNRTGHMPNEYIDIEDYIRTIKVYGLTALLLLT